MPPKQPHIIFGKVSGTGSTNAVIMLDNLTTGESISGSTDASGHYALDCASFPSGYTSGDTLNLRTSAGTLICERSCAGIDKTDLFQIHNIDKLIKVI